MKTLIVIASMFMTSCLSSNYKVKELENTRIITKGQVGERTLGLNDKQELILQEERDAADELRIQEHVNLKWSDEVSHEAYMLKWCRQDLSDPRLGGEGVIPALQEIDGMKSPDEVREEIGITEDGEVKVVKKAYFVDKLKLERKYEKSLKSMLKTIVRHREECEYKMGIARRKMGLPSSRFNGALGGPNENDLDDAFRILKERQDKGLVTN